MKPAFKNARDLESSNYVVEENMLGNGPGKCFGFRTKYRRRNI